MRKWLIASVYCVGFIFGSGVIAHATAVQFALGMANPDSVFAISPAKPGPVDVIKFFDPIDHQTYGNNCEAGFGVGEPSIAIDPAARTIDITFTLLPPPQICPLFFRPVSGLEGDFGPLPAGEWTYRALPYTTATFTVVPEPSSLSLILVGAALSAARGLGRRLKPPLRVLPRRGSMISPL